MENTGETDRLKLVLSSKVEQVRLQVRDLNTQNQLFKAENEADVTELKIKAVLYEAQLNNNVKIITQGRKQFDAQLAKERDHHKYPFV